MLSIEVNGKNPTQLEDLDSSNWRTVQEFPTYEVSRDGRVRNAKTNHVLSQFKINSGYYVTSFSDSILGKNHKRLTHRVVALAWCDNPDSKNVVNHINSNKLDNRAENLEWVTTRENLQHARDVGRMVYNKPTKGLRLKPRGSSGVVSKYVGVYWVADKRRWAGQVTYNKRVFCKRFVTELEAALWREQVIVENNLPVKRNFDEMRNDYPAREYTEAGGNGSLLNE